VKTPNFNALADLSTPALVIDEDALLRNIDRMAAEARGAGLCLRPHAKTHKCKEIALLQLRAGAVGIACATIAEAEAFSGAGIGGILVTSPMMGSDKFARVAKLNREGGVTVVVDHVVQIEGLLAHLQPDDPPLAVAVDVDIGQNRTGVTSIAHALELARASSDSPRLSFAGLQGFAGHVQHIIDFQERKAAAANAAEKLRKVAGALTSAGQPPRLISGSGTGAYGFDATGPYNELQVGSYVFMDADYARIVDEKGNALPYAPSLFVLATVVSINRPGEVTVDAGTKALATNGPTPFNFFGAPAGAAYRFAGDEHGIITFPVAQQGPTLGARLLIGATHCDPTVNLHARYHVFSGGKIGRWNVLARYEN
jgi:D-serine deaminase-like pyridoxal phosphate-dependent protein